MILCAYLPRVFTVQIANLSWSQERENFKIFCKVLLIFGFTILDLNASLDVQNVILSWFYVMKNQGGIFGEWFVLVYSIKPF